MEFKLPEIGEGVHEGELIRWLVKEGDAVKADQPLIEVMTDKATVEVPSPTDGTISGFTAKDGDMIKVGQTLASLGAGGEQAAAKPTPTPEAKPAPEAKAPAETKAAPENNASMTKDTGAAEAGGNGPQTEAPQRSSAPSPQATSASVAGTTARYTSAQENLGSSSIAAAPIVRAMAQKSGVDLSHVMGSGPDVGGQPRVLEADLLKFLANKDAGGREQLASNGHSAPAKSPFTVGTPIAGGNNMNDIERKPLRGLRRAIANAMVKSKYTAPHYSYVDEFECSSLVEMKDQAKASAEKMGIKFSYLPFIVKAVVAALKEFPVVNASLEDGPDGQTVLLKHFYHIGIAVATKDGLVVPVIKNADRLSLLEIAKQIQDLSERTRQGKATGDELKGSTFTITSMGNVGGLFATPIINYPEVGIMGVYRVQEKPIVKDHKIEVGRTMHLSLSLDHRVVDGVVGAEFCNAVIARLAQPARLMLEMV